MPDILHDFVIYAPIDRVFEYITTSDGLDKWWTKRSSGIPLKGSEYNLWFGPEYNWFAEVTKCLQNKEFELKLTRSDPDWKETLVGFQLTENNALVKVNFYHKGWSDINEHYRISSFCWAMYLRILKRFLENDELVEYEDRLLV